MASKSTIARPYAKAAFEIATSQNQLDDWSVFLEISSVITQDEDINDCIDHPNVDQNQLKQLYLDILKNFTNDERRNFLQILFEKKRLTALPSIKDLFLEYRAKEQKKTTAKVATTSELSIEQQQQIKASLKKRLNTDVEIEITIDPSLIGGILIQAGDIVIDGSIKSRLNKLKAHAIA